jgi:hypothetical protein
MRKKLTKKSQYVGDLSRPFTGERIWQSQMGEGYALAELGDVKELMDRLGKYDIADRPVLREIALKAIGQFTKHFQTAEFLSEEEGFNQLNFNASVGYGARLDGIPSRQDPRLQDYLQKYLDAVQGQPHHVLITASQKDEMRAMVDGILKTPRLFMSYPVEHTFLATLVLGDFVRQLYESSFCVDGGVSAVGDSIQHGALRYYKEQMSKRPYLYCTDTSGQDASVPAEFIDLVYDHIKTFFQLNEHDDRMFEAVRFNSIHKMLNVNGHLYLCSRGLASGDYLTIIINMMWRLYLAYTSYNHDLDDYHDHNTTIICGDDFASSSDFGDLNHDSEYATITWAGRPVSWDEMDFCSTRFSPNIHHDAAKVLSVLYGRRRVSQIGSPAAEMQRLAGLLRVHTNEDVHKKITKRMEKLCDKYGLVEDFNSLWVPYEQVYDAYNYYAQYD